MALKLIANYSKRLGLPGYSSHQFSVCVETEIHNVEDVAGESTRLYKTLQRSVDEEIQQAGFVPDTGYGHPFGNNGSRANRSTKPNSDSWNCSDKQRELIQRLVSEHSIEKTAVEQIARDMFGTGVRELNRLQASGLIDRLIADYGETRSRLTLTNGNGKHPRGSTRSFQRGGSR